MSNVQLTNIGSFYGSGTAGPSLTGVVAGHGLFAFLWFLSATAPGITSIVDSAGTTWAVSGSAVALATGGTSLVLITATSSPAAGTHTLTVTYTGGGAYVASMGEDTLTVLRAAAVGRAISSPASGQTLTPGASIGNSGDLVYMAAVNDIGSAANTAPVAGSGGFTIPSTGTNGSIGAWAVGYNASAGNTTPSMAPGSAGTFDETGVLAFALESGVGAALAATPSDTTTATGTLGLKHIVADLVFETTTTTGTSPFSLAGAVTGFRSFGSVMSDQDTCLYLAQAVTSNVPNGPWEVGIGTYNLSTNSLTRTQVLKSSNSNAAVSFASGTTNVALTEPAEALWNKGVFNAGLSGSSITIDWSKGPYQMVTLTANCTVTFENSIMCPHGVLELYQDATGSRVPTLTGAVYRSGSAPSWSTVAGAHDTLDIHYNAQTGGLNVFMKT